MPTKTKQQVDDMVEYKVYDYASSTAKIIEDDLNVFASDGWRVITAVQSGSKIILERDIVG